MIDGVGTYRTAEFIGRAEYPRQSLPSGTEGGCASETPGGKFVGGPSSVLMKSDLMNFFNFVKIRTEPQTGGGLLELYKPGAAEMYGQVGLIAALDRNSCVRSLSLTVRRSFFEEQETSMFGRDIMKSFLRQVPNLPPSNEGAVNAFIGKAPLYETGASPDHLRIENINASNGAPLLRMTIW